jgi:hypothetical protein
MRKEEGLPKNKFRTANIIYLAGEGWREEVRREEEVRSR